nr:NUDIX hydrolase [Vibrio splendidus]MCC4880877.1 NUDIX hydrolase [Vibrio splendidus]
MTKSYLELPLGQLGERNAAFIGFYLKSKVWSGFDGLPVSVQDADVGQVCLIFRWDARFGFPGGLVDDGELIIDAAVREAKEEINFSVDPDRLNLLSTHQVKADLNAHFYFCEISELERDYITQNAHKACHFGSEMAGVVFLQCVRGHEGKGLEQFLSTNILAPAVRQELELLISVCDI